MNLTEFFIKKYAFTILLLIIITFGGIKGYLNLPRDEDPGFNIRTAVITTYLPSADAKKIDDLITDKIEKEIRQMGEVEHVRSRSLDGVSVVYVDVYDKHTVLQPIWDKLRRRVEKTKAQMPAQTQGPYVDDEFGDVFGTIITISGDDYSYSELKDIADEVKDELLTLSEAAKVEISGNQERTIYLEYDNSKLLRYGLSPQKLSNLLSQTNIIASGGSIKIDDKRLVIEPSGDFEDFSHLEDTVLNVPQTNVILYLKDIVRIKTGYTDPPKILARSNGKKAIVLSVSLKDDGNILTLGEQVKEKINFLENKYPIGVQFDIVAFQPQYVKQLTDKFVDSLVQSVVIVFAVILVLLGRKIGFMVGSMIPLAILCTFMFMHFFNIGIDKISLSALIISLGILVDNSIVIAESVMVGLSRGKKLLDAIYASANEYKIPLLISSSATVCAFLPIILAKSQVSEYSSSLFTVMAIALFSSWFLSATVLPFLCFHFLKNVTIPKQKDFKLKRYYKFILRKAMNFPKKTFIFAGSIVFLSLFIFSFVPKIFFPSSDRAMFEIELNLPVGTDISVTSKVSADVENYILNNLMASKKKNGVVNFSSYIGTSAPRYVLSATPEPVTSYYAMILVNTVSYKNIDEIMAQIQKYCDKNFSNLNAIVRKVPLGPPFDAPVEIRISGYEIDKVFKNVKAVSEKLRSIKGVTLVEDDWGAKVSRIKVNIRSQDSMRLGVTNEDIAFALESAFGGKRVSIFRDGDTLVPIVYRLEYPYSSRLNTIDTLNVFSSGRNIFIPLAEMSDTTLKWEFPKIYRRDAKLTVTVKAQIDEKTTAAEVIAKMKPFLNEEKKKWQVGYDWEVGGTVEASKKGNKSITDELPVAGMIILFLMIYHFNSFKKTFIVLFSSLLALSGANFGLFLAHSYFGFMTFLGYISLIGIVMNNAVVLVNEIEKEQKTEDVPLKVQIEKAAVERFRPILLTAATTIGGMLPLWVGRDPMFSSMAAAIIFGLCASVCITLLFTPVLYYTMYNKNS